MMSKQSNDPYFYSPSKQTQADGIKKSYAKNDIREEVDEKTEKSYKRLNEEFQHRKFSHMRQRKYPWIEEFPLHYVVITHRRTDSVHFNRHGRQRCTQPLAYIDNYSFVRPDDFGNKTQHTNRVFKKISEIFLMQCNCYSRGRLLMHDTMSLGNGTTGEHIDNNAVMYGKSQRYNSKAGQFPIHDVFSILASLLLQMIIWQNLDDKDTHREQTDPEFEKMVTEIKRLQQQRDMAEKYLLKRWAELEETTNALMDQKHAAGDDDSEFYQVVDEGRMKFSEGLPD